MIEFLMVPGAPQPVAPFSHATAADGWLFVTGQMPTDPDDDVAPLPAGIEAQTRRVIDNLQLVLAGVGSGLDRVVFARVYLTHFERDYASFTSFQWNFLVLPTGQIMALETDGSNVWYYNPSGSYNSSWQPAISSLSNYTLSGGSTYQISGTQLNGLSQGAYYGDDAQAATNYPIVRITNNATGHVFFANTSGWSNGSIAPNNTSNVNFKVPSSIENGVSSLVAIANGIPSQPVSVTVGTTNNCGSSNYTLSVSVFGNPGGTVSSPSGINCGSTCSKSFSSGTQVTLTATPDTAWGFFGWSGGGCSGLAPTCTVTLNGNTSVSATFSTLFGAEQMSGTAILPAPVIVPYPQTPIAY
jgi:2-iminobutanoate/2-iminopropanoate deaminase